MAPCRCAGAGKSVFKVVVSSWGHEYLHMPGVRADARPGVGTRRQGQVASADGAHRARPLVRHLLHHWRRHRLRHLLHDRRQRITPVGCAFLECRMQFPRPCVELHIRIVGIATFVDAVESSLNRIACETAPRMCARNAHVGPLRRRLTAGRFTLVHPCARGPANSHADPLVRAWAALPRHGIAGLRAIVRVSARNSGFSCELHARPGAVVPVSQTTSATTPHCWRLSPRWSALWAPHRPKPRPHRPEPQPRRPEPQPRRQQTGGIAPIEARHAGDTPWRDF